MIRWHEECIYCAEPATHDAELVDVFGDVHVVAVCADCGRRLLELDQAARAGGVA